MIHARTFFTDIFRAWGFSGPADYARTVLGVKTMTAAVTPAALKVVFVLLGYGLTFWGSWVWHPPGASFLILGMDLVNAWYGYQVARQIKSEKFKLIKFQKTFSVMASDILAMSMVHHGTKYLPLSEGLRDVLFSYLFGFKFTAIFNHWVLLKLQSGSFVSYFRDWMMRFLTTKMGAQVVDSVQNRPPEPEPPTAPPADEPAADETNHS